MTTTLCLSGAVLMKAGANVSSYFTGTNAETNLTPLINQAESYINVAIKEPGVNFVTLYSTLDADVKQILQDAASSHAAIAAISYDMSGYTSKSEAAQMLNVNYTRLSDALILLKDKKHTDFMQAA